MTDTKLLVSSTQGGRMGNGRNTQRNHRLGNDAPSAFIVPLEQWESGL